MGVAKEFISGNEGRKISHTQEFWAAAVLLFTVFHVLSFISYDPYDLSFYTTSPNTPKNNFCGITGAYLNFFYVFLYGFSVIISPLFLLSLVVRILKGIDLWNLLKWFFYYQLALFSGSVLCSLYDPGTFSFWVQKYQLTSLGGILGSILGEELVRILLGKSGSLVIFGVLLFISFQGVISFSYFRLFQSVIRAVLRTISWIHKGTKQGVLFLFKLWKERDKSPKAKASPVTRSSKVLEPLPEEPVSKEECEKEAPEQEAKIKRIVSEKREKNSESIVMPSVKFLRKKNEGWNFPPLDLLNDPSKSSLELEENIQANALKLVQTLKEFDIPSEVVGVESGPVITRYEIQIATGIKVQKVTALDNDIGYAMRAKSVRIIAPIPGKSAIGIEIPNQFRKMVTFKELLASEGFKKNKAEIPLVLGKDIGGKPVIADLGAMPHLLIAGATGAGKSVCINTVVISLLYTLSPSEVKIMMVDPKKVELATYKDLPHLMVPLITNPNKVAMGLRCLIEEMDKRYRLFKEAGVRNLAGYNKKDKTALRQHIAAQEADIDPLEMVPERLPFIVVIIDELADLMMVAKSEIESSIVRLAQLSRAVGIHMILATQRPSVDVVTGLIKANVPARIAFRVSARVDSRTVLDSIGAEKLLGKGDMLFLNPGDIDLRRLQGAYLEDEEINRVVDYWKNQGEPEYDKFALSVINRSESGENQEQDPLFDQAVEAIKSSKQASTSFLQKCFRIGYNRASRLIDELEARGVIGPPTSGGKTREIYVEEEDKQV